MTQTKRKDYMAPELKFERLDTEDFIAASVGQRKKYEAGDDDDWNMDN